MPKPFIDTPRPVWLTREQRDYLAWWAGIGHLDALVAAWDAAPADATQAALRAAEKASPWADNGPWPRRVADAVLRALGMPDA